MLMEYTFCAKWFGMDASVCCEVQTDDTILGADHVDGVGFTDCFDFFVVEYNAVAGVA